MPFVDTDADHAPSPSLHAGRHFLASPADVYTQRMFKQIRWIAPLVALELPRLTRGEDCNDAVPVVWLELLWGVDEDESERAVGVDGGEEARDLDHVGRS